MTPQHDIRPDDADFVSLVAPHMRRLSALIDGLIPGQLRARIDAKDIVQDTMFEAARLMSVTGGAHVRDIWPWIATIGRNRLINAIKAQQAAKRGGRWQQVVTDDSADSPIVAVLAELAVYRRTPSRSAANHELRAALDSSLSRLAPDYRDAVKLRYVEGKSLRETADSMSRTEESVRKLCLRGLQALRLELRTMSLYV